MHNRLRDTIAVLSLTFIFSSYASNIRFVDVTEQAGIHFEHAGGIDLRVVPALVGSGAAWCDYDNDGKLDLYIANSALVRPEHRMRCYRETPSIGITVMALSAM